MSRTFTPVDLVQLPRIDSNSAVALASAVQSAAAPFTDLPAFLTDTLAQIGTDKQVLIIALAKTPGGPLTVKEADRRVDKVAVALHDNINAWASIAEFSTEGQNARIIMERVFQDGRSFVNLKVKEEWAAIETKLATIDREGLQSIIDGLGAGPLLTLLKQLHAEYGATIGTTQVVEEAPEIRDSKDMLLDSLRTYVLQVVSTVKRGQPETAARADALLAPIRAWESTKAAKEKAEQSTPAECNTGTTDTSSTTTTSP